MSRIDRRNERLMGDDFITPRSGGIRSRVVRSAKDFVNGAERKAEKKRRQAMRAEERETRRMMEDMPGFGVF